jgi:hypothetical protein
MQLESHEGAIAGPAAFTRGTAHQDQRRLELGSAAVFISTGLRRKPLRDFVDRDRRTAR